MSRFNPVDALIRYHAAIDARDFASIERMFAEAAVYVSPGLGGTVSGRDAILERFRAYFADYADQTSSDDRVEALDAFSAEAHWRLEAKSSQTGRPSVRRGTEIVCFDKTGRITSVEVRDDLNG